MTDSNLAAFLNARLDEDEAAARAAIAGPWVWDDTVDGTWDEQGPRLYSATATWAAPDGGGPYPQLVLGGFGYDAWGLNIEEGDKAHIARHDPARVLREVEAKRRIINAGSCDLARSKSPDGMCSWHGPEFHNLLRHARSELAAVYRDHPDYDPAWA